MEFFEEVEAQDRARTAPPPALTLVTCAIAVSAAAPVASQALESEQADAAPAMQEDAALGASAADMLNGRGFTAAWLEFLVAHKEVERINARQIQCTSDVFGVGWPVCDPEHRGSIRHKIVDKVLAQASKAFCCPGAALDLDRSEVEEALGAKANHYPDALGHATYEEREEVLSRDFDPDAIWQWLQHKYEGGLGEMLGRQKAAKKLFVELSLLESPPVMERAQLLVTHRTWSEKLHRGRCYSLKSLATFSVLRQYLSAFADWAGDAATAATLRHAPAIDEEVRAHQKRTFGAIQWTLFSERVDIRLSPDLSTKFRQFLVEFGPRREDF